MKKEQIVEINIRYMTISDIPAVSEIEKRSFSLPWSEKSFEESIGLSHAIFLVAEKKQQILGYCGMYQVFDEGDITNIAVLPEYRGMGIAGRLLETLFGYSVEKGIADITLEVRESNESAIHLYEKYGFERVGIRKNFYEKPVEHAVIMWKRGLK